MKKDKKFKKATPVIETKEIGVPINAIPGSVDEFIEILKQFPSDAKFTLNGTASVDGFVGDDHIEATIYKPATCNLSENDPFFNEPEACITDECKYCEPHEEENVVMKEHLFGIANGDNEFLDAIRHEPTDDLISSPLMMPNTQELRYEGEFLAPPQIMQIDEIRQHNLYVAECMGEMYRRQIAALLEYNTQCMAHFGLVTNRVMCRIVDDAKTEDVF